MRAEYATLDEKFGYSKKSNAKDAMQEAYFVGISRVPVSRDHSGTVTYMLRKTPYCTMVCDKYMKYKIIQSLRTISTPMEEHDEFLLGDDQPGFDASVSREYVGCLLYIARGTRGDLSFAVTRIARGVAGWTKRHDNMVERIIRYLWHTRDFGLVNHANPLDLRELYLQCWFDADHAEDASHSKSVSGFVAGLAGPYPRILLEWCSRLHTSPGKSTPEVELVAGADALTRSAWPLQQLPLSLTLSSGFLKG